MKTRDLKTQKWNFPNMVFKVILVFLLIIFAQYCYISLSPSVYGINMDQFAANRNTYSTTLYASRGTLYDHDGNTLALNIASYTVIAYLAESRTTNPENPQHVVDKHGTATKLAPLLDMSVETIENLLNKDVYQVELGPGGRGITELKKEEIENLNLPGIDFIESSKRYYPNGDFASYIIGYAKQNEEYVDKDGKTVLVKSIDGELGIELKYDDILKGINGYLEYQQDRFGYKIPDTLEKRIDAQDGKDIYLTIDSNIQRFLETAVKDASNQYKPQWMMIHVMDAKTGDILGSASTPSFDPNIRDIENYENPLVSYVFEPGSTMKTFTYMCAIDKGTYQGDQTVESGNIKVGDSYIYDWNQTGWGTITYDLGYEYSSNVAITNIVQNFIDKTDLKNCFTKYGFGTTTNIELPREFDGSLNFNYPIEVATAGFGQGIYVTPVQILQALTIIANNGKMIKPHIVSKIVDPNNGKTVYERQVEQSEQLISESTVKKMKQLMWNTVNANNPGTTGTGYKIEGLDVIGKTGTAQIYDNQNGGYLTGWNDYIYSFTGMFPNDDPEIIIYAAIKQPNVGSSSTLTSAVKSVMENIAKYKNINSENMKQESLDQITVSSYISRDTEKIKNELTEKGLNVIVLGNGNKIINQYPQAGSQILAGDRIFLITNGKEETLLDIKGWSRLEVQTYLEFLNIPYEINGYGFVKEQSIKAGTKIDSNNKLIVTLENKKILMKLKNQKMTKKMIHPNRLHNFFRKENLWIMN